MQPLPVTRASKELEILCAHEPCSRGIGTRTAVLKDGRIYCCLDCAAQASRAAAPKLFRRSSSRPLAATR